MKTKCCSRCGETKDRGEFYDMKCTADKLRPYCMGCVSNYYRKRREAAKAAKLAAERAAAKPKTPPRVPSWQKWQAIAAQAAAEA